MNRKIKFRAWDKEKKVMHEWDNDFFYDTSPVTRYSGDFSYISDDMILMQYTELNDKNDKEVYHKDIIEYDECLYVVEWDEINTGFYLADIKYLNETTSEEHMIGSCARLGEVIGNIYENQELLERK